MNINLEHLVSKVAEAVESVGHELVNNLAGAIDDLAVNINITDGFDPEKIAEQIAKAMRAPQGQQTKEESNGLFSGPPPSEDEWAARRAAQSGVASQDKRTMTFHVDYDPSLVSLALIYHEVAALFGVSDVRVSSDERLSGR